MSPALYLNLYHLFHAVWRRRYTLVWPVLIMPVFVLLVGVMTPHKYISHTTMLIQETSRLNPFMADFAVSTQLEERISALNALLHSRHILSKVALETGAIDQTESAAAAHKIQQLSDALQVQLIGTDMIKISYTNNKPEHMATTLNVVTTHFLDALLAPEKSSMSGSETFLDTQLKKQELELHQAELKLADFKKQYSSTLPDQFNFDVQQLRSHESLLMQKKNELTGATATLESFRSQLLKANPLLASVEQEMITAQSQLSQLQSRYTDQHSLVIVATNNLARLQAKRETLVKQAESINGTDLETLWQLAAGLQNQQDANGEKTLLVSQLESLQNAKSHQSQLEHETKQLQQVVDELKIKLDAFSGVELQLTSLERDIGTKSQIYNDLLKRHEQARVTMALGQFEQHDRVKIIDPPFTPHSSINMALPMYAVVGLLGGVVLGFGLMLASEVLDSSITRRDVAMRICQAPVFCRIPNLSDKQHGAFSTIDGSRQFIQES